MIDLQNTNNFLLKHGNINPENIYLIEDAKFKYHIDNALHDPVIYSDIMKKPAMDDMNDLGDTLIKLILRSDNIANITNILNGYDLYLKIKAQIGTTKTEEYNLEAPEFNINLKYYDNLQTEEEKRNSFQGSAYDFIYRLKNKNIAKNHQFKEVTDALKHSFVLRINEKDNDFNIKDY